jgi:hypothetical protein
MSTKPILAFLAYPDLNHPWLGISLYFGGVVVFVLLLAWWLNSRGND